MTGPDVHVVSYGAPSDLDRLLASLRTQSLRAAAIRVWHNGPEFPLALDAEGVQVFSQDENLGFGAAHNRLFERATADVVVLANPDLELEASCLERLCHAFEDDPRAVLAAALLVTPAEAPRVNAFGLRLTLDLVGVNPDRGRDPAAVAAALGGSVAGGAGPYLAPSGALFAVHRRRFQERIGAPLLPESLFLYQEDVALGLRVRARGGGITFVPGARAVHLMSVAVGRRSALKLYHVERNRLWIARLLLGNATAIALLGATALRYAAYAVGAVPRAFARATTSGAGPPLALAGALARGLKDGLWGDIPEDLRTYLADVPRGFAALREHLAPLGAQLSDPTAE